ncbi:MAG: VWA domain-containing protein [Bacteroidales bacterium]|nr:VWA domain-containing protein [Bacteroidales bacterium]
MSSTYSLWFIPLCLLAGIGYAMLLYGSGKGYAYPPRVRRLLFALRAFVVSALCFLLLRPVMERKVKEVEKPVIVIGIDNSESVTENRDSVFYRTTYTEELQKLIKDLSKDYQVDPYLFGNETRMGDRPDFRDKETDLSQLFSMVEQQYAHRNVGAVVCLSDGIATGGGDPLYTARRLRFPIYTVALGDTSETKDALIANVHCNRSVFRGNRFPLEILVQARQLKGKQTRLQVLEGGKVIFEKDIRFTGSNYSEWVRLHREAGAAGMLHYRIRISATEGERTESNNTADVWVQVLDESHPVAIVYQSPHPDVAALKEALRDNPMYTVECFPLEQFHPENKPYEVWVLHQLPTNSKPMQALLEQASRSGTSLLFFTGDMAGDVRLPVESGLQVRKERQMQNDAYPALNPDFADFNIPEIFAQALPQYPPIQLPFGQYTLDAATKVCLYQRINNMTTPYPLLFLHDAGQGKSATVLGEGWWRWRMHHYLSEGSHEAFNAFTAQLFQYLTTKEDKRFFRVKGKNLFSENERIRFDAECYTKNYELDNRPEVEMSVRSLSGSYSHRYVFSRSMQAYQLDLGTLPEGDYQWTASTRIGNSPYSQSGHFSVQALRKETLELRADHQLLLNLAEINGAKMLYPKEIRKIAKEIRSQDKIKSVARYTKKSQSLLDNGILGLFLLLLLGGEWALRKWSGNY